MISYVLQGWKLVEYWYCPLKILRIKSFPFPPFCIQFVEWCMNYRSLPFRGIAHGKESISIRVLKILKSFRGRRVVIKHVKAQLVRKSISEEQWITEKRGLFFFSIVNKNLQNYDCRDENKSLGHSRHCAGGWGL